MDSAASSIEESSATNLPNLDRFAWAVVGSSCIPYLFRENTKYVPVRIVSLEVEGQFSKELKVEEFRWQTVEADYLTKAESDLLNQINKKHCELIFGEAAFNESDLIVKLDDVIQYYNFLVTSCKLLLAQRSSDTCRCGFVRINDDNNSIVPYVVKNNRKYLPVFYFDDETKSLEAESITLENWDLAYLKLCCKAQGIRDDLIARNKCDVTSLEQIKSYFSEDTKFDEFWPVEAIQKLQFMSVVEASSNQSRGQAPAESQSRVADSRRQAPPAAKTQQSHMEAYNHSREPASAPMKPPPPSYQSSMFKSQYRFDTPTQNPNDPRNSYARTTNLPYAPGYQMSSGPHTAMTTGPYSRPHPPPQPIRNSYTASRGNYDPRQKW